MEYYVCLFLCFLEFCKLVGLGYRYVFLEINSVCSQYFCALTSYFQLHLLLWAELCPLRIHMLSPNPPIPQNVVRDGAFKEVIKLK